MSPVIPESAPGFKIGVKKISDFQTLLIEISDKQERKLYRTDPFLKRIFGKFTIKKNETELDRWPKSTLHFIR